MVARLEAEIRSDIVMGRLPPGHRLLMSALVDRYQASQTPVREALQRLAEQGMVILDPNLGARIVPVSLDAARDLYVARRSVEPDAARLAVENGDAEWLTQIRESVERLRAFAGEGAEARTTDAWSVAHNNFHAQLVAACPSSWLRKFVDILAQHSERYRILTRGDRLLPRDHLAEHERLVTLAQTGDAAGMALAMERHLNLSLSIIEQILDPETPGVHDDHPGPIRGYQ
jgi:DNA-binding GntR family transcriptional regulator